MNGVHQDSEKKAPASPRLASLDAYRGLVMFLMLAEALQFHEVSRACPDSGFWRFLAVFGGFWRFPGVTTACGWRVPPACLGERRRGH